MGMQLVETEGVDGQQVFQSILEVAPGGFSLDETNNKLKVGDVIQKGELVQFTESTRKVLIDKLATVYEAATGTDIKIYKGHCLAVGDIPSSGAVGGEAYAITAINTSNAAYDTITVGTALGSLSEYDVLWLSSAAGATAGAYAVTPNGVNRYDVKISANDSVSAVIRGTVYERRLPGIKPTGTVPAQKKTDLTARILFSQSF